MLLLEPHEYIDVLGFNFKHQLAHYGGLYLISTEDLMQRGICKVGIASHFGRRMKTFRSCFGFFTKLYLFGLIVIDVENAKERNKIEKQILAAFNELRLPYPDTENNTEWLVVKPDVIKTVFDQQRNNKKVSRVITNFAGLTDPKTIDTGEWMLNRRNRVWSSIDDDDDDDDDGHQSPS